VTDPAKAEKDAKPADKADAKAKKGGPLASAEVPPAAVAVMGGMLHATRVVKQLEKALLQIETLGPFAYDVERNVARFDVLPQANPHPAQRRPRHPHRGEGRPEPAVLPGGWMIEFNGSATGPQPPANKPASEQSGPTFKKLHAWTHTPGRYLTISSEDDKLEAYGFDLVHEQDANRTTLHGVPLKVVQSQRGERPYAGKPAAARALVMQPGPDGRPTMTVRGAGRLELVDDATGESTITASWQTSLVQVKETIAGVEHDALTFNRRGHVSRTSRRLLAEGAGAQAVAAVRQGRGAPWRKSRSPSRPGRSRTGYRHYAT